MTVIAGVVERGRVWLAADSQATGGWDAHMRVEPKVYIKGPMVLGAAGSPREGQLIQHQMKLPDLPAGADLHEWMVLHFVEAMRSCLKQAGAMKISDSVERTTSTWLVGIRGRLFAIHSDLQVSERVDGFDAVGCGMDHALGALYVTKGSAGRRLDLAVNAAARFSAGVGGRVDIVKEPK